MNSQTLLIVFHDMRLGGIQRKIIDIINYYQDHFPHTKIILCLRERQGIFLKQVPKNVEIISPNFYTRRFNMTWFTLWLIGRLNNIKPTQIMSFMDLGSVPTIISLKLLPWIKTHLTIGEDILTSKYIYIESFPPLRRLLIKWLYPHADNILVQTPVQKKDLEDMIYSSHPNSQIITSPNWLPLAFPPPKITPQNQRDIDILFVGRLDHQKNLPLFLDIVSLVKVQYPKLKVYFVGDGDQKNNLKKIINRLHLRQNVFIQKPTLDTISYYSRSKIFLLSSNYEGFPLTLIEAISCGCFPVVRNIPELSQFFTTNRQKIIYDNPKQAANIIKNILEKSPNSGYLQPYLNKILKNQQKDISAYIKYFSPAKAVR